MKKIFYFLAIASVALVSCQEKNVPENKQESSAFTFKASIESLDTKGDPAPAGESSDMARATINGDYQLLWATGDMIGVYASDMGTPNQSFTLESGEGTTEGVFKWDGDGEYSGTSSAAFFPWDNNKFADGVVKFKLPNEYWSYNNGKMLTPLVARLSGSTDPIQFKHAGAAVKLTINNLAEGTYKIKMSVYNKQITGNFHVNPADAGTDVLTLDASENTSLNNVTLNTWKSSGAFTWIFPVPELTTPKLKFEITDDNGILVWKKSLAAQENDLGRADILVMPAKTISPYEQFNTNSTSWTVYGGSSDTKMVTDGTLCIAKGVTFAANDKFLIRKDKALTTTYGYNQLNGILSGTVSKDKWHKNTADGTDNYIEITTVGTYDIIFNSSESEYCGYAAHEIRVVQNGFPYPMPIVSAEILIDGSFDDWAEVTPAGGPKNGYTQCKATYDADYIYFYSKTTGISWASGNYFYYCLDTDNNTSTGGSLWDRPGFECFFYIYPLSSTEGTFNTSPTINRTYPSSVSATATLAGAYNSTDKIIEVELKVSRTAALVSKGNTIRIWTYADGDQSGYFTLSGTLNITK